MEKLKPGSILLFLSFVLIIILANDAFSLTGTLQKKRYYSVVQLKNTHILPGMSKDNSLFGKIYLGPSMPYTRSNARQVCGNITTMQDGQHFTTPGRQIIYAGYYNSDWDYVYLNWTFAYSSGSVLIRAIHYAFFDWKGTHDWDYICCDQNISPSTNSAFCNIDAIPGTGWPVVSYQHGADAASPFYNIVGDSITAYPPCNFSIDSLPATPNIDGINTGYSGDGDSVATPYLWPHLDVDTNDAGMVITHVASTESYYQETSWHFETRSLIYYRKVADSLDQPWTGTWEGPYFMDSAYTISSIVRSDKTSNTVYYAYLKPLYYETGTPHPCGIINEGYYQITNNVVYKVSNSDGAAGTWSGPNYVTDYGSGFEAGETEPAAYDLTGMVDPNGTFHLVWSSPIIDPDSICNIRFGAKMWHWDNFNNCISLVYDASSPSHFWGTISKGNLVISKQSISWCDDRLYIAFNRFGSHPVGDSSKEIGAGPVGADTLYQVADIMVVASDADGGNGITWTNAVNLTDTDGTNCEPGNCFNEVSPTMAMYSIDSLMIEYIEDKDPGANFLYYEGSITDNPVMFMTWPCFAMSDVDANCAYTTSPDLPEWEEVALAPNGQTTGCNTPAEYSDSVILANDGNVDINYTAVSDAAWLEITGGADSTASAGRGPRGLSNGCASPAIIKWTASSATLAAGNYTGTITVDIADANCADFDIVINAVVTCLYYLPEYATIEGGCWTVDVWNTPRAGNTTVEDYNGNMKFYACGGDSTIHPLYNEAFMVGWNNTGIVCYGDMMGDEFRAGMRTLDSIQVSAVGNPEMGQGYWKSTGFWCTPDSIVYGKTEYFVPGHMDTAVLIEKVELWNEGGTQLNNFVAGEGIDWDVRSDSNYDQPGIDMQRQMVYQHGCRQMDSVVAGLHCHYGNDAFIGATVVENSRYIYDNNGYHPDTIYNLLTSLDGNFTVFQDSCTDLNSVYRFWEGILMPFDTLKFCKVKAVSIEGVTGLQQLIDKGVAYILVHNLCNTVEIPDWPADPDGIPPPGGGPGGGIGKDNEDNYKPPAGDPIGTQWHELWPVYCQDWTLTSWIDNGDSVLSHCDTVDFTNDSTGQVSWEHIKVVTPTIIVEKVDQPSAPIYMDGLDENFDVDSIEDPVATYWHEVAPNYGGIFQIVYWEDNDNGYLDSCDYIWLHALNGPDSCTTEQYHVISYATDIITTPLPTPGNNKHNEDGYKPGDGDPIGTVWHELYPTYCKYWTVLDWIDNGDGVLSYCDTLISESDADTIREHVKLVTTTITAEGPSLPEQIYLAYLNHNPMNEDLNTELILSTYWHEEYPNNGTIYQVDDIGDNGNGYIDSCDWINVIPITGPDSGAVILMHVLDVATDIVTKPEETCQGMCGNCNSDSTVDVSDAVCIINYVFVGGDPPRPVLACGDCNNDCQVNVSDAVCIINYVFIGGASPGDCCPGGSNWHDGDCCPFIPSVK